MVKIFYDHHICVCVLIYSSRPPLSPRTVAPIVILKPWVPISSVEVVLLEGCLCVAILPRAAVNAVRAYVPTQRTV